MTDDGRALTGRSAVFGRLSSIVKSFHARTEIALAGLATQKPEYPFLCGLCAFARDIPSFGCGVAALGFLL